MFSSQILPGIPTIIYEDIQSGTRPETRSTFFFQGYHIEFYWKKFSGIFFKNLSRASCMISFRCSPRIPAEIRTDFPPWILSVCLCPEISPTFSPRIPSEICLWFFFSRNNYEISSKVFLRNKKKCFRRSQEHWTLKKSVSHIQNRPICPNIGIVVELRGIFMSHWFFQKFFILFFLFFIFLFFFLQITCSVSNFQQIFLWIFTICFSIYSFMDFLRDFFRNSSNKNL